MFGIGLLIMPNERTLAIILTPVILACIGCLIYYMQTEIQIDSCGISQVWPFNVKKQIRWEDISEVNYSPDNGDGIPTIGIKSKNGIQNMCIRQQYKSFLGIAEAINSKFPFKDYQKISK